MRPQLVASSMSQLAEAERRISGAAERAVAARRMARLRDPNTGGPLPIYDAPLAPRSVPTTELIDAAAQKRLALRILAVQMWHTANRSALNWRDD